MGEGALPSLCADVAQLVEHQLPKLRVAGSSPVVRFKKVLLRYVFAAVSVNDSRLLLTHC
jgi:hypothetical protein